MEGEGRGSTLTGVWGGVGGVGGGWGGNDPHLLGGRGGGYVPHLLGGGVRGSTLTGPPEAPPSG